MKKIRFTALSLVMCICFIAFAGCAPSQKVQASSAKPVLLVVSFGTSYNDSRDITIGAIESALRTAYPQYEQRRAFTSQTIIDILAERDGLKIDNVTDAMQKIIDDGVKDVIVQPTHIMSGYEYDDLVKEVSEFKDKLQSLSIGLPLLSSDEDYKQLASAITLSTSQYDKDGTAVVFMGHGTGHSANETYSKLQQVLTDNKKSNYYIGTVEATPSVDDILSQLKGTDTKKVVLVPLMIVAGDHAVNDMAGDEQGSWKTIFKSAGYDVTCVLSGLGQIHAVREMFIAHAGTAMGKENIEAETPDSVTPDDISSSVQASSLPADLSAAPADGVYKIAVESSSSMFNVVDCELTVKDGSMTALITMSGDGYGKMFMGTADAASSDETGFVPAETNDKGEVTFLLPIDALDKEISCAAWSIKKEKWYDRTLVFSSTDMQPING